MGVFDHFRMNKTHIFDPANFVMQGWANPVMMGIQRRER
jgi:hypothetical protein